MERMPEPEWRSICAVGPAKLTAADVDRLFWECVRARDAEQALKLKVWELERKKPLE